ncbi:MAG: hypothetical protein HYU25_15235 [Candidatus Rokubacteria bacterium]|nr:hypothetical protein [Candidatus Rokubacteria bacterium]
MRANCGVGEADTPETVADKVRVALHELGMDAEAAAPYVLSLDLTAVAHAEGDAAATRSSLREAHALFASLGASRDVARAEALARSLGIPDAMG